MKNVVPCCCVAHVAAVVCRISPAHWNANSSHLKVAWLQARDSALLARLEGAKAAVGCDRVKLTSSHDLTCCCCFATQDGVRSTLTDKLQVELR